jgi:hypothetical protein
MKNIYTQAQKAGKANKGAQGSFIRCRFWLSIRNFINNCWRLYWFREFSNKIKEVYGFSKPT